MADNQKAGGNSLNAGKDADKLEKPEQNLELKKKKQLTPQQQEKERERRRRRRRRKKMLQGVSSELKVVLPNGLDKGGNHEQLKINIPQDSAPLKSQQTLKQSDELPKEIKPDAVQPVVDSFDSLSTGFAVYNPHKENGSNQQGTDFEKIKPGLQPEDQPEIKPEFEPMPVPQPAPEPQPEPEFEPVTMSQPAPESQPESEFEPVPVSQPAPQPQPEPEFEPVPEPQPAPQPQPEPEFEPMSMSQPAPQLQSEPQPQPEFQPDSQPQPQPIPESDQSSIGYAHEPFQPASFEEVSNQPIENSNQIPVDSESEHDTTTHQAEVVESHTVEHDKSAEKDQFAEQDHELLAEKKPFAIAFAEKISKFLAGGFKKSFSGLGKNTKKSPGFFARFLSVFRLKYLLIVVLLLALGWGLVVGYNAKLHEKLFGLISGTFSGISNIFKFKPAEQAPPQQILLTDKDFVEMGLTTAAVFGHNSGSNNGLIPDQIKVATFFGQLLEPKVQGETGLTAAIFYGELKDQATEINEFVSYMSNLAELQNLYKINVYQMLDQTTKRDTTLLDYLDKLQKAKVKSNQVLSKIGINMADLQKSFDSLSPSKTQTETDFFAAMSALQPEKSDTLLKEFVDIVQKQAALKARLGALIKLTSYYQIVLASLDKRIQAVDKNKEALIQGIRVIDVPGGGVDIIIKPTTTP